MFQRLENGEIDEQEALLDLVGISALLPKNLFFLNAIRSRWKKP
ncbi:hypothetical protein ACFL1M_00915 [Patescibacteria group bacterium]